MPEQYQVYFSSRASNATVGATNATVTFNCNWGGFLPTKYKRFLCQFIFKSENYTGGNGAILTDNGLVNIAMGSGYTFDGNSRSNNFGIIYPVVSQFTANIPCNSYYNSTNNDNNQFYMNYPNNNLVLITLKTFAGASMANMPHWTIYLNMIGVSDTDDVNDNF